MPERDRREASLADAKLRMLRVTEILAAWEDWGPPGGGGRAIRVRAMATRDLQDGPEPMQRVMRIRADSHGAGELVDMYRPRGSLMERTWPDHDGLREETPSVCPTVRRLNGFGDHTNV